MSIYVVRHGQTEWNVAGKCQGKKDIELNEMGKKQAEETAKVLKNEEIDLIISSPLKRAKETAEIIKGSRPIDIVVDERISERDFGEFEGMTKADFDSDEIWDYEKNKKYEKAENVQELFDRVSSFLNDIKENKSDKNILIVTHGGIGIPINWYFNGTPKAGETQKYSMKNCQVVKYEF